MSKGRDNTDQLLLFGELVPTGGGNYKLVPQKPVAEVTPRHASRFLGVSRPTIYRILHLLDYRRPSPGKILITMESLQRHKRATSDPEFWQQKFFA